MPETRPVFEMFIELAKALSSSEEILSKLKEKFEDPSFIHASLSDLLEGQHLEKSLESKAAEILRLTETSEDQLECEKKKQPLPKGKN